MSRGIGKARRLARNLSRETDRPKLVMLFREYESDGLYVVGILILSMDARFVYRLKNAGACNRFGFQARNGTEILSKGCPQLSDNFIFLWGNYYEDSCRICTRRFMSKAERSLWLSKMAFAFTEWAKDCPAWKKPKTKEDIEYERRADQDPRFLKAAEDDPDRPWKKLVFQ